MVFAIVSNIVALALSILSLVTSGVLAWRQASMMRHANELPVLVELTQEVRSIEFQRAEAFIVERLGKDHRPDHGLSGLPEFEKNAANQIMWYFNTLGAMIALDIVDEPVVIPLFGFRIKRLWSALEPFVLSERTARGDNYAAFFEDLVCRVHENWPPAENYKLSLKRMNAIPD